MLINNMERVKPRKEFKCMHCGKKKIATRYDQKFCSIACGRKYYANPKRRGTKTTCIVCGKEFTRTRDNQKYCSISCSNLDRSDESNQKAVKAAHEAVREKGLQSFKKNPTTKLGKRGYLLIYIPVLYAEKKPGLDSGWMKYHHFVWWKHYGELPPVDEQTHLHHIDGDKYNNSIDNLKVMDNSEHLKTHWANGDFNKR